MTICNTNAKRVTETEDDTESDNAEDPKFEKEWSNGDEDFGDYERRPRRRTGRRHWSLLALAGVAIGIFLAVTDGGTNVGGEASTEAAAGTAYVANDLGEGPANDRGEHLLDVAERVVAACDDARLLVDPSECQELCFVDEVACCFEDRCPDDLGEDWPDDCPAYAGCGAVLLVGSGTSTAGAEGASEGRAEDWRAKVEAKTEEAAAHPVSLEERAELVGSGGRERPASEASVPSSQDDSAGGEEAPDEAGAPSSQDGPAEVAEDPASEASVPSSQDDAKEPADAGAAEAANAVGDRLHSPGTPEALSLGVGAEAPLAEANAVGDRLHSPGTPQELAAEVAAEEPVAEANAVGDRLHSPGLAGIGDTTKRHTEHFG